MSIIDFKEEKIAQEMKNDPHFQEIIGDASDGCSAEDMIHFIMTIPQEERTEFAEDFIAFVPHVIEEIHHHGKYERLKDPYYELMVKRYPNEMSAFRNPEYIEMRKEEDED